MNQEETLRENILTGIAAQLKVELDLALAIIESLERERLTTLETYRCVKTLATDFHGEAVAFTEGRLYEGLTSAIPTGEWALQFTNDLNEPHLITTECLYEYFVKVPTELLQQIDQAHQGDPCIYCGKPHDEVGVGPCPGRTARWRGNDNKAQEKATKWDELLPRLEILRKCLYRVDHQLAESEPDEELLDKEPEQIVEYTIAFLSVLELYIPSAEEERKSNG